MRHSSENNPVYGLGKRRVHFSVSRKVGQDDVRISISGFCEAGDERLELGRLQFEAIRSLSDYVDNVALESPSVPASTTRAGDRVSTYVTRFVCSFEGGIKKVKAISPDFPKYGVIVFDEVLAMIGLTKADISLEHGMEFDPPLIAHVVMSSENKPQKVVHLKRAE